MSDKKILLNLSRYENPGLYLDFHDGIGLELTLDNLRKITEEYWFDPEKIPPNVKDAVEFRRCKHCLLKGRGTMCDAIRPVLPLLEIIDSYNSYDPTTAIYKGTEKSIFYVSDTSMQRALSFVSNLSLIRYCQVGRQYRKYFMDVIPLMETEEIANRLFLNIFWINNGDAKVVDEVISSLVRDITRTSDNQLNRLRLICKNDVFINAFIITHLLADILNENRDKKLKERLTQIVSSQ